MTIAIVAILAAIALPDFGTSMRNSRVTTQTNNLLTAINLARTEAITRTRGVSVCAADTSAGTPTACGAGTDWAKGWIVFVDDTAGAVAPTAVAASSMLRSWEATAKTSVALNSGQNFIRFSPRGESRTGNDEFTILPTDVCTNDQKRLIDIYATGRADSKRALCP